MHTTQENGSIHLLPLLAVVVIAVAGSGYLVYQRSQKADKTRTSEVAEKETTLATPLPSDLISVEKIKELASANSSDTVQAVQLENEEGTLVFKVKLAKGSILTFNAKTGAVIHNVKEPDFDGTINLPANFTPAVSFAKARDIAQEAMPGKKIKKIELEFEDGSLRYSVRFTEGARVDIDAASGSVVRTRAANGNSSESGKSTTSNSTPPSANSSSSSSKPNTSNSSDDNSPHTENEVETETHSGSSDDGSSHGGNSGSGNSGRGGSGN